MKIRANPSDAGRAAARRAFERFHQAEPDRTLRLDVPALPESLTLVGQVDEIVYSVPAGVPSERAGVRWRHKLGDTGNGDTGARPYLLADPEHNTLLIVPKPGEPAVRLTERGLVG